MKTIRSLAELERILQEKVRETKPLLPLSEATGIAQSRLSDFQNGKRKFPLERLNVLANHFGVKFRLENWTTTQE